MSEITDLLQQKVGLSAEQAQQVEQVVLQHLQSRVPSEFQGIFASFTGGGAAAAGGQPGAAGSGGLGSLLSAATGLFGGNKS